MNIKQILGNNIKYYRKKAGLTQDELSEKLDVSPKHLSNIEVGQKFASSDLIEKLCEILNVPPSSLFYDKDNKTLGNDTYSKIEKILYEETEEFLHNFKKKLRE